MFNPTDLADNMKKSGGFIPGIRPGKQTAKYFDFILNRIGLIGALYLGILAVSPSLLRLFINVPFILSGTSLLIMVGVALETSNQIESYLIENRYEGLLSSRKSRSRSRT
jgi:preprotein translocase subunit SecY